MTRKQNYFGKFHSQLELPFIATDQELLNKIFKILEIKFGLKKDSSQTLVDLGSGDGAIVIFSSLNYGIKSIGIEIDPVLINEANQRIMSSKKEGNLKKKTVKAIKIKLGDLYVQNLKKYDFIYLYSLPSMQKYLNHVLLTAKKGSIIISHKYPLKGFNSYLALQYKLRQDKENQNIFTYYYEKFR